MAHVRTQICAAIQTVVTGLDTTGSKVFRQRKYPVGRGNLPGWLIYRGREVSEPMENGSPRLMQRTAEFHLEGIAEGDDADDVLDQMASEAEAALSTDITLGGLCADLFVSGFTPGPTGDPQGEKSLSSIRLTIQVSYLTTDQDPDTPD